MSTAQPRHACRLRAQVERGRGWGSQSKAGALRTRGQRKTLPARRSGGAPVQSLYRKPPRSATQTLPPPRGGRPGEEQTKETENSVPRGRDDDGGQGSAGAALGFRLRLPSTPGYRVAEKQELLLPAGCPILLSLPSLPCPLPAPPPPAPALSSDCVRPRSGLGEVRGAFTQQRQSPPPPHTPCPQSRRVLPACSHPKERKRKGAEESQADRSEKEELRVGHFWSWGGEENRSAPPRFYLPTPLCFSLSPFVV